MLLTYSYKCTFEQKWYNVYNTRVTMESVWVLKKLCTHVINLAQDGADGHYLQDVKFCFSKIFRTSCENVDLNREKGSERLQYSVDS